MAGQLNPPHCLIVMRQCLRRGSNSWGLASGSWQPPAARQAYTRACRVVVLSSSFGAAGGRCPETPCGPRGFTRTAKRTQQPTLPFPRRLGLDPDLQIAGRLAAAALAMLDAAAAPPASMTAGAWSARPPPWPPRTGSGSGCPACRWSLSCPSGRRLRPTAGSCSRGSVSVAALPRVAVAWQGRGTRGPAQKHADEAQVLQQECAPGACLAAA